MGWFGNPNMTSVFASLTAVVTSDLCQGDVVKSRWEDASDDKLGSFTSRAKDHCH